MKQEVSSRNGRAKPRPNMMSRLVRLTTSILFILAALLVGFVAGNSSALQDQVSAGDDLGSVAGDSAGSGDSAGANSDSPVEQTSGEQSSAELLHPSFDLTGDQFRAIVSSAYAGLDPALEPATVASIQQAIFERPQVFLDYISGVLDSDPMFPVLADKGHFLSADYVPGDLIDLNEYSDRLILNRNDLSLRTAVMPDLFAMLEAARQEGILIDISSSYRSYSYQEGLFQRWVDELGLEEAERISARPGTSQHQLGTTMDFGSVTEEFGDTQAGIWLAAHSLDYGFSLSYPDGYEWITGYAYEPWHFRYVGPELAYLQSEFFQGIQQYMLLFMDSSLSTLEASRL